MLVLKSTGRLEYQAWKLDRNQNEDHLSIRVQHWKEFLPSFFSSLCTEFTSPEERELFSESIQGFQCEVEAIKEDFHKLPLPQIPTYTHQPAPVTLPSPATIEKLLTMFLAKPSPPLIHYTPPLSPSQTGHPGILFSLSCIDLSSLLHLSLLVSNLACWEFGSHHSCPHNMKKS